MYVFKCLQVLCCLLAADAIAVAVADAVADAVAVADDCRML